MLILYKNDSNVRFVLFTKTSTVYVQKYKSQSKLSYNKDVYMFQVIFPAGQVMFVFTQMELGKEPIA